MTTYTATLESLRQHTVPDWFHDAKLGIFIHWGLYSVPAWAPPFGDMQQVVEEKGWEAFFANMPYAEWYLNSMHIPENPTYEYHRRTYGTGFAYEDFVPMFNDAIQQWDPTAWAQQFKAAGARYVVLTSRHCESFALWPTSTPHPDKGLYHAKRDLVGELAEAVRGEGLRFGIYYCGGMDWTFNTDPVRHHQQVYSGIPNSPAYIRYINAQWRELIDRYQPDLMWNDIGWPRDDDPLPLMATYYNTVPDGVINDRFAQHGDTSDNEKHDIIINPAGTHNDFRTPEYSSYKDIQPFKWEACRGIGHSFGYNRAETDENYLSVPALVQMLADIVSKNGNLLLNVGPEADGGIISMQQRRLAGLGAWLADYGEAIYGTRPWERAEGITREGHEVRFTQKDGMVYALVFAGPGAAVTLTDVPAGQVVVLGRDEGPSPVDGTITLPQTEHPVHVLKLLI
jgi:alpha-L-fucosidase